MTQPVHKSGLAIVTGAAQGIGHSITTALANVGYALAAIDSDEKKLASAVFPSSVKKYCVDVGKSEQVRSGLEEIFKTHGTPVVLVNNAGVGGPFHRLDQVSDEEWSWIMDTNLRSVFMFARACLPLMAAANFGRIVNIASIQGQFGAVTSSTYSASKHGVIGYTRSITAEWGAMGITANAVCPGYISTAMGVQNDKVDSHGQKVLARTPSKMFGSPQQVSSLVEFLVKIESGYINGSVINIDGGISADVGI